MTNVSPYQAEPMSICLRSRTVRTVIPNSVRWVPEQCSLDSWTDCTVIFGTQRRGDAEFFFYWTRIARITRIICWALVWFVRFVVNVILGTRRCRDAEVSLYWNTDCTDCTNVCCANAAGKEPMGDSQKSCIKMGGRPKVLGMFFKECRRFF